MAVRVAPALFSVRLHVLLLEGTLRHTMNFFHAAAQLRHQHGIPYTVCLVRCASDADTPFGT